MYVPKCVSLQKSHWIRCLELINKQCWKPEYLDMIKFLMCTQHIIIFLFHLFPFSLLFVYSAYVTLHSNNRRVMSLGPQYIRWICFFVRNDTHVRHLKRWFRNIALHSTWYQTFVFWIKIDFRMVSNENFHQWTIFIFQKWLIPNPETNQFQMAHKILKLELEIIIFFFKNGKNVFGMLESFLFTHSTRICVRARVCVFICFRWTPAWRHWYSLPEAIYRNRTYCSNIVKKFNFHSWKHSGDMSMIKTVPYLEQKIVNICKQTGKSQ